MGNAVFIQFLTGVAALALSGCATFSPDGGIGPVARYSGDALGKSVAVVRDTADTASTQAAVERLRRRTLSADTAVQIALLNNRGLQAAFNELSAAEAEMVGDSLPPNPTFSLSRIAGGGGSELEVQAAMDIVALATLPVRSEIAKDRFRRAQLWAIEETLRLAAEVRRTYYRAVAARELSVLMARAQGTAQSTAKLATKLGETGSLSKLDQAREQVFYAETTAELATIRQQADVARERLIRLLGLWGSDVELRLPETLPQLPSIPIRLPSIEADAVGKRVDLQMARIELQVMAKAYGLTQATRFISLLETGPDVKRTKEPGGSVLRERGMQAQFQVPLFDFGEVKVRQAEASYMGAVNRLTEKAVIVRSQAREAYRTYRAAYDIASHYQREILPLRKIISDENQLRFGSMQTDIFTLLQETRQQIASTRASIEAKRSFWLAAADLKAAVLGGGTNAEATLASASAVTNGASGNGH